MIKKSVEGVGSVSSDETIRKYNYECFREGTCYKECILEKKDFLRVESKVSIKLYSKGGLAVSWKNGT